MRLRDITVDDWPQVLALNDASVKQLSLLDEQRLAYILSLAHSGLLVECEGRVAAFAIAIAPGTSYDSLNYAWLSERFDSFLYLDRIAVAAEQRRRGIGTRLYDVMEAAAAPFQRMVCDVNVKPPNEPSLAFHRARGYCEVGRLQHGAHKTVVLLGKEAQISR